MWSNLAAGVVLLFLVGAGCLTIMALRKRKQPHADGRSRVTGSCGDSIEVRLTFSGQRAVDATARSDGCAYSCTCAIAAARLAKGRTAAGLHAPIVADPRSIGQDQERVGLSPR